MPIPREKIERMEREEQEVVQEILRFLSKEKPDCFYTTEEVVEALESSTVKDLSVFNNLKRHKKEVMITRLLNQLCEEKKIEGKIIGNTLYFGPLKQ